MRSEKPIALSNSESDWEVIVSSVSRLGQPGRLDCGRASAYMEDAYEVCGHFPQTRWIQHASRYCSGPNRESRSKGTKSTPKAPSLSLASPSPAPPPPATATCRGQARLCAPISAAPKQLLWTQSADAAAPAVHGAGQSATTACSAIVCGPVSAAADRQDTTPRGAAHAP